MNTKEQDQVFELIKLKKKLASRDLLTDFYFTAAGMLKEGNLDHCTTPLEVVEAVMEAWLSMKKDLACGDI